MPTLPRFKKHQQIFHKRITTERAKKNNFSRHCLVKIDNSKKRVTIGTT